MSAASPEKLPDTGFLRLAQVLELIPMRLDPRAATKEWGVQKGAQQ